MTDVLINLLGLFAGGLIASSTIPDLISTLNAPAFEHRGRIARNIAAAFGNGLWVLYATMTGAIPIILFCSINFVLLSILAAVQIHRRKVLPNPQLT